jgi:hypothetical protein
MTIQKLADTIFVGEPGTSGMETLAEMCVRQYNSVKFSGVKEEICKEHVLLNTSQKNFESKCRPVVQKIGKILSVPKQQADVTWARYQHVRVRKIIEG